MKKSKKKQEREETAKIIKKAQRDPEFMSEIKRFIKAATSVYKLH